MDALPYYKWYWIDYRANRKVQRMSWQAKGLYRELLDEFWSEGVLPRDHALLAEICGCDLASFLLYWPEIQPCFEDTEDGLINAKMDDQRTTVDAGRVAKARAGAKGGRASNSFTRAKDMQASAKQVQAQPDIAVAEQSKSNSKAEHIAPTALAVNAERGKLIGRMPLPGKNGGEYDLYEEDAKSWQDSYPGIDVRQKLREIKQWLVDNPTKRKTAKGIRRFINSWLSREQDRPGGGNGANWGNHQAQRVSPAVQRGLDSRARIAAAVADRIGRPIGDLDGRGTGELAEAGATSGHGRDVAGTMGGNSDPLRHGDAEGRIIDAATGAVDA